MTTPSTLPVLAINLFVALSLLACNRTASTTTERSLDEDGRDGRSWVRTWSDHGEFRCIASSPGGCRFVVFTSDCLGAGCRTQVLHAFSLPTGQTRKIGSLPIGFRHCVAHGALPVVPLCDKV